MSKFVDGIQFFTEECCNCGMAFAMTKEFKSTRLNDHKSFWCPAGHRQYYSDESDAEKQKRLRCAAEQKTQHEQQRRIHAEEQRKASDRRYGRIRDRVKNGVCSCCNRSFENLARHMATKHPDFEHHLTLKTLRRGYGLTQLDLAIELSVSTTQISLYENKKPVSKVATNAIKQWMDSQ